MWLFGTQTSSRCSSARIPGQSACSPCQNPHSTGEDELSFGIPRYDYLLGRKLFGPELKWALFRPGHIPERLEIPAERRRPELPIVA